ncbi:MAG: HD domain-containing protein [Bacilli bacterium]|nr:HD domain-containing protein [Bacilli bacterium]
MDKEINFFEKYTHSFDLKVPDIERKYYHTYRVMNYAEDIAKSLDLEINEITRAKVCALFHDLGRFPQFTEYKTYIDNISFDHGDKSEEILKENNYNDEIVLKAVKYHNKLLVPKFDDLTNMHCNIVRDADKLDIMDMQINELDRYDYKFTEEILNCFKNHTLVDNSFANNIFINLLRMIAFIFDINYKRTIEIIVEKDIIKRKLDLLRMNTYNKEVDIIEKEIKEYIKERFDVIC